MQDTLQKLHILPKDDRDLSHDSLYGTVAPSSLPTEGFSVSPLPPVVLDQIDLDFCTGEATSELNTKLQWSQYSLIDYLRAKKLPYALPDRGALALKYGLVPDVTTYINMALLGTNANINLQIISNLMFENGEYFDPLFQMSKIKQVRGEWKSYGANLRDAANALVTYGSLPKRLSPFTYKEGKITDQTRDFLANWSNWAKSLDTIAQVNKVGSYLTTDGPYDAFDNICSALYTNFTQKLPCGVLFGLNWRQEWTSMPNGIVNENYASSSGEGHAVYFIGVRFIDDIPYIVCQNSWSKKYGSGGLYFLPRNVVNTEFATGYGSFVFKKISVSTLKYYNNIGISVSDSVFTKVSKIILNFLKI